MSALVKIALMLFVFLFVTNCKPGNEQDCTTAESQEIVVNPLRGINSQLVYCNKNKVAKIARIQRVFMHEWNVFSFMVETEEGTHSIIVYVNNYVTSEFVWDVPRGELAYALCKYVDGDFFLEMHLYSKDQIEGASWDHGKGGSGQTSVVPMERP